MLDLELPDSYGINTFLSIHNKSLEIPIIILTGLNDEKVGVFAIEEGAYEFLVKGQMECRLIEYIQTMFYMDFTKDRNLVRENYPALFIKLVLSLSEGHNSTS